MNKPHRQIRSFVRREGRVTTRQQQAIDRLWDDNVIDLGKAPSFEALFRDQSVTLEIGFGMGASLAEMASQQPEQQFLGVEVHRAGVGALLADIESLQLGNIKIICEDALLVLKQFIPDHALKRVLLFFPDPWHKKRHNKRRIVQPPFIELIQTKLKPNGIFHLATDWLPYAEYMQAVLEGFNQFKLLPSSTDPRPQTKFERRGIEKGHVVTDLVYQFV